MEDSTQSLELTMLNDGTIEDFHIESDWRDNIDPEDLGASITALIGDANTELLSASGTFLEENYEDWQEEQEEHEFNSLTSPVVQQTRQDADEILERASGQMVPLDDSLAEAAVADLRCPRRPGRGGLGAGVLRAARRGDHRAAPGRPVPRCGLNLRKEYDAKAQW